LRARSFRVWQLLTINKYVFERLIQ